MSQIHVLNHILSAKEKKDYYFYCLESHGELTFILEYKGELIYANIHNVMVTHKSKDKKHKALIHTIELELNQENNGDLE